MNSNKTFGRAQSVVAGSPKNGVQFMVKDSKKYASTGGWGYAQFDDGKPADDGVLETCHPCHRAIEARDFVYPLRALIPGTAFLSHRDTDQHLARRKTA
jgi:hypothetical protein